MDPTIVSIILSVLGAGLGAAVKLLAGRRGRPRENVALEMGRKEQAPPPAPAPSPVPPGTTVLIVFTIILVLFGAMTIVRYWPVVTQRADSIFFATWLLLTMIGGMFVQVVSSNYRAGRELFNVSRSQLIFPLLFALIVFYPVWAIGASSPHSLFSFYAAFLNGFFWETVVAGARLPAPGGAGAES